MNDKNSKDLFSNYLEYNDDKYNANYFFLVNASRTRVKSYYYRTDIKKIKNMLKIKIDAFDKNNNKKDTQKPIELGEKNIDISNIKSIRYKSEVTDVSSLLVDIFVYIMVGFIIICTSEATCINFFYDYKIQTAIILIIFWFLNIFSFTCFLILLKIECYLIKCLEINFTENENSKTILLPIKGGIVEPNSSENKKNVKLFLKEIKRCNPNINCSQLHNLSKSNNK